MTELIARLRARPTRRTAIAVVTGVVIAVASASTLVAVQASARDGAPRNAVVETQNGFVRGESTGRVRAFHGIPYAAPPTGQRRWQPPQEAESWSGVRAATDPGSDCVQTAVAWRPAAASTDEDCLSLNVWAPRKERGSHRPVAVWFHGGGSVNGAARDFEPVRMVTRGDMLVVTVNYRLGALGYLTTPELDGTSASGSSGNYGLLDQVQALRWVQANIAAFGGDPDRVMIAGQSAGASSVCGLLASPRAAGLFDRAVIQSSSCRLTERAEAHEANAGFVEELGCADGDAAEVVACLRESSPTEIIDAQQQAGDWGTVRQDGVLPLAPTEAFRSGEFNQVPVLLGATETETRAFVYERNDLVDQPVTEEEYVADVRDDFGDGADAVLGRYPVSDFESPGAALAAVGTDSGWTCPMLAYAGDLTTHVSTHVYEFRDETAPLRPYELVPSSFSLATQHSAELPYLWGSNTITPFTRSQERLADEMVAYWSRFADSGTLDPRRLPEPAAYDAEEVEVLAFRSHGSEIVDDMADNHHCGFWADQP